MSIFFSSNKEQKDYIREELKKRYPNFKTGGHIFKKYLKKYINDSSIILDAGCGDNGMVLEFMTVPKLIVGIDIDKKSLDKNQIINKKIVADLKDIPLNSNSVDIVLSEFVIEHIDNPDLVFKEISRVLKPGGVFVFITPNIINPIIALSKILPHNIHSFLRTALLKKEEEAYRTYYRANTYNKLLKLRKASGFHDYEILRVGNPEYAGFCKPLVSVSIFFEKLIDNDFFNIFKMYLIGRFIKR